MKRVIESKKVKKDLYTKLYSDLHYIPGDNLSFLKKSVDKMVINKPDYIFFLGDLIDDSRYTKEQLKEIYDLVYRMSKLSKVLMVLGNHDQFTRTSDNKWLDFYNKEYVNDLKNRGIIVLQNESYEDDNICAYGTKFSGDYYENREPIEEFIETMKLAKFNPEKFDILMEHSPNYTFDKEMVELFDNLKDVDLTLAGHFHNGCIPWYIDKFLPGNFGLIDPYMNVLPKNARGVKQITDTNLGIISAPLTTFNKISGLNKIQPLYYPTEQDILIKKK